MQNQLEWRHAYQERLEKLYASMAQTASAGTAQYGDSQPNSRLAIDTTERCKQCWTALTNLSSSIGSRYQRSGLSATLSIKQLLFSASAFHVHMLQTDSSRANLAALGQACSQQNVTPTQRDPPLNAGCM